MSGSTFHTRTETGGSSAGAGFADWKTIGTSGADYTDVQAMITAGFNKGMFITNITEDSAIAVPAAGLILELNTFTLTMGENNFTFAAAANVNISGPGEIDYTFTGGRNLFAVTADPSVISFKNLVFDNNSTVSSTSVVNTSFGDQRYEDVVFQLSDTVAPGITISRDGGNHSILNCEFIGGGTSCRDVLSILTVSETTNITGLKLSGTFHTTSDVINLSLQGTQVQGLFFDTLGALTVTLGGQITNVYSKQASLLTIDAALAGLEIKNADFVNVNIDLDGSDNIMLDGIRWDLGTVVDSTTSTNLHLSNSKIASATTLKGDSHKFTNVDFGSNLTIDSTSSNNRMTLLNVSGSFATTGTLDQIYNSTFNGTFTVNAAADDGLYLGNRWIGAVSVTSDEARYSGKMFGSATFTLNATATNNVVEVTIDQTVVDNGTTNDIIQKIY